MGVFVEFRTVGMMEDGRPVVVLTFEDEERRRSLSVQMTSVVRPRPQVCDKKFIAHMFLARQFLRKLNGIFLREETKFVGVDLAGCFFVQVFYKFSQRIFDAVMKGDMNGEFSYATYIFPNSISTYEPRFAR